MVDDKNSVADSAGLAADAATVQRLQRIDGLLQQTAKFRRFKTLTTTLGLALVLLAIVVFAARIVTFVKHYNLKELTAEIEKQATYLVDSKEARDLIAEIQVSCIPELQNEIVKKFKAEEPTLKNELNKSADNIKAYLTGHVKEKVISSLIEDMKRMEREMLIRKGKFSLEDIEHIVNDGQKVFVEEFTAKLEKRVDDMSDDLVALNAAIHKLTETAEYAKLDPKLCGEYENRVIESMLELVIYKLNPSRGEQLSAGCYGKGGAQ